MRKFTPPRVFRIALAVLVASCATAKDGSQSDAGSESPADAGVDSSADAAVCEGGDIRVEDPQTGHCFMYFNETLSWDAASARCQELGASTHLASVTTIGEANLIVAILENQEVWIGGTDAAVEGSFEWTSGEPFEYSRWRIGEPNNGPGGAPEHCISAQGQLDNRWDDKPCAGLRSFICERN